MSTDNYRLLIRNLRKNVHAELAVQTVSSSVRYDKIRESVHVRKRFNLITGRNNSIGKSTLVKNLFWAIGCDPDFDENWRSLDCKAMLEFSVSGNNYVVVRVNNTIILGGNDKGYVKYYKITGEYSEALAELVGFNPKLPNRANEPELETPPPAYYFLPFYIDQLRSWVSPWNSFSNLGQYAN